MLLVFSGAPRLKNKFYIHLTAVRMYCKMQDIYRLHAYDRSYDG